MFGGVDVCAVREMIVVMRFDGFYENNGVSGRRTIRRNEDWKTPLALFHSATIVVPNSVKAHMCKAAALHDIGKY